MCVYSCVYQYVHNQFCEWVCVCLVVSKCEMQTLNNGAAYTWGWLQSDRIKQINLFHFLYSFIFNSSFI